MTEVDAYEQQLDELGELLASLATEDWDRETRCSPLTVRDLVAHVVEGMGQLRDSLAVRAGGPAVTDRVRACDWNGASFAAEVVDAAVKDARSPSELLEVFNVLARDVLSSARAVPPDAVVGASEPMRADDLVAVHCLEIGVHSMDIGHAVIRGERIVGPVVEIVTGILAGLLGEPLPRSMGWDAKTFILSGTGRRALLHNERHTLGPLAERFPLLV